MMMASTPKQVEEIRYKGGVLKIYVGDEAAYLAYFADLKLSYLGALTS